MTVADVDEEPPADVIEKFATWLVVRETVWGLPEALSLIVKVPVEGPEATVVKVT